jgi:hypothetical protein
MSKETIEQKQERIEELEAKISRKRTFKLIKSLMVITVLVAVAIGVSIYFPGVRDSVVNATSGIKSAVSNVVQATTKWEYNSKLEGIAINENDGFTTICRNNLDQQVAPVVASLEKWGKSIGSDFLIFGGSLFRDSKGELIWRINGFDTSMGAVLDKAGKNGIFLVNNPEGLQVPNSTVTTGALSLTKETVRFLGFLWQTGDRYVVRASNFFGNWEAADENEFYFTQNRLQLARSESELTPAICAIGVSLN